MPMHTRRRPLPLHFVVGFSLLDAACTHAPPAPPALSPEPVVPPSVPAAPSTAQQGSPGVPVEVVPQALRDDAVTTRNFSRRVLFSWTTDDQLAALRQTPVLLTREASPTRGASRYDQELAARASGGDAMATALRQRRFARARFAWTAPWATVAGWPTEDYGRVLLRVVLRGDAWVAHLRTGSRDWIVRDMNDRDVPLADALAHPERIGAVYFVHDAAPQRFVGPGTFLAEGATPFREFVLCNETMIESWEVGTAAAQEAVARDLATLDALIAADAAAPDCDRDAADPVTAWRDERPIVTLGDHHGAALAFVNEYYRFHGGPLRAVRERLASARSVTPSLAHRVDPRRVPPPPRGPRPSLTPPRPRDGTY